MAITKSEIYKNIYDICKKYNGVNHSYNKTENCLSSELNHTIEVEGTQNNFTSKIFLKDIEQEPDGCINTVVVYIRIVCNDDRISIDYNTKIDSNYGENAPENKTYTSGEYVYNAEIPEVIDFISKLHTHIYQDSFSRFTSSTQPDDFEGWKLISELKNYLKSLE